MEGKETYDKSKEYFQKVYDYGSKYNMFAQFFVIFIDNRVRYLNDELSKEFMMESYDMILPKVREPIFKEKLEEELSEVSMKDIVDDIPGGTYV